jgi:four helix bundle protein
MTEDRRQRIENSESVSLRNGGEDIEFKKLRVYQLAFELQQAIFEVSKLFPLAERYALTNQIRRSSRSIGANISEAWQKRRYVAHFVSKLTDADGEQAESQHCSALVRHSGGVPVRLSQMLGTMMAKPEKFCRQSS